MDIGKSVIKGLKEAIDISSKDKFKVTYNDAREVTLTRTSLCQTLNIIKTLNDVNSKDFVGKTYSVEELIDRIEEIAERMVVKTEFEGEEDNMKKNNEYIEKNKFECTNYICFGCGRCILLCEYCGSALKTFRKSEDNMCYTCFDKSE